MYFCHFCLLYTIYLLNTNKFLRVCERKGYKVKAFTSPVCTSLVKKWGKEKKVHLLCIYVLYLLRIHYLFILKCIGILIHNFMENLLIHAVIQSTLYVATSQTDTGQQFQLMLTSQWEKVIVVWTAAWLFVPDEPVWVFKNLQICRDFHTQQAQRLFI